METLILGSQIVLAWLLSVGLAKLIVIALKPKKSKY